MVTQVVPEVVPKEPHLYIYISGKAVNPGRRPLCSRPVDASEMTGEWVRNQVESKVDPKEPHL